MGAAARSVGGFFGVGSGANGPTLTASGGGPAFDELNHQNDLYANGEVPGMLQGYANGTYNAGDLINSNLLGDVPEQKYELINQLATNPLSGSKFATDQVQNNAVLGGLFGKGGQLESAEGRLNDLQNQGFNLKPEDQTLYGQESGNIARQFGQQGNQAAQSLASRGLSNSGAAGAMFSGISGNQNEMLAQAQQQIAQQRFQNTMNQIQQQQNFVSQLGQQGANAINQQYGRQLSGAQNQKAGLQTAAGLGNQSNQIANQGNYDAASFNAANVPENFMDMAIGGANIGSGSFGKTAGQGYASSMFSPGSGGVPAGTGMGAGAAGSGGAASMAPMYAAGM